MLAHALKPQHTLSGSGDVYVSAARLPWAVAPLFRSCRLQDSRATRHGGHHCACGRDPAPSPPRDPSQMEEHTLRQVRALELAFAPIDAKRVFEPLTSALAIPIALSFRTPRSRATVPAALTLLDEAMESRARAPPVPRFEDEPAPSAGRPPSPEAVQHVRDVLAQLDCSRSTWLIEDVECAQRQPVRRRRRKPARARCPEPDDTHEQDLAAQCLLLMLASESSAVKKRGAKRGVRKAPRRCAKGGLTAAEALQATRKRRSRKPTGGEARSGSLWRRSLPVYAR